MTTVLLAWLNDFSIIFILSTVIFLLPLKHRESFFIRMTGGMIAYLLYGLGSFAILEAGLVKKNGTAYLLLLCMLALSVEFILFCCKASLWDAVLGTACAYSAQNFTYSFVELVPEAMRQGILQQVLFPLLQCAVIALLYFVIARQMSVEGRYDAQPVEAILTLLLVLLVALILSSMTGNVADFPGMETSYRLMRLYGAMCCLFILIINMTMRRHMAARRRLDAQTMLWEQQKKQLSFSRGNIELINQKLHDLKHQIQELQKSDDPKVWRAGMKRAEEFVTLYNSTQQTGNPILDTVLTEASLICEREQINWTCIADGKGFGGMDGVDLYGMVHGLLEIALASSRAVSLRERRVLAVSTFTKGQLVIFQTECFFEEEPEVSVNLQVICEMAVRYGGSLSVDRNNHILLCMLLLPKGHPDNPD